MPTIIVAPIVEVKGVDGFGIIPAVNPNTGKQKLDRRNAALYRARCDLRAADRLAAIGVKYQSRKARNEAELLSKCADPTNRMVMRGITDQTGEAFDGIGSYFHCQSIFCSSCQPYVIRKNKATIHVGVEYVQQNRGAIVTQFLERHQLEGVGILSTRWRLFTFTFPTLPGCPLRTAMKIANAAWIRMGECALWQKSVIAGCKAVEWTLGKTHQDEKRRWSLETDGYNVHIHVLVLCLDIDPTELRRAWTRRIKNSCKKAGFDLTIKTATGHCIVNVRQVHPNYASSRRKGITTLEGAIGEVCKYVTKPSVWIELPDQEILMALDVKRWPRRFSTFGAMYGIESRQAAESADSYPGRILDKQSLSTDFRRGKQRRLAGERRPTLRELGLTKPSEEWSDIVNAHVTKVQEYRRVNLVIKHPNATLEMLDGEAFGFDDWLASLKEQQAVQWAAPHGRTPASPESYPSNIHAPSEAARIPRGSRRVSVMLEGEHSDCRRYQKK